MRFIEVKKLPEIANGKVPKADHHKYGEELAAFMRMNVKIVRVDYRKGEFQHSYSAYRSLTQAIQRHALPIDVCLRNGKIYLVRRDI